MTTIISHFEIIFKKQAPINGVELETVLQGYFLELTNLEEKDFLYDIEFISIPQSNSDPGASLSMNTLAILDNPGAPQPNNVFDQLTLKGGTNDTFIAPNLEFRLAAKATAKLTIVPQIIALPEVDETPVGRDIEVRGYVQISLPEVDGSAQSPRPLKILTHAQNRASFFDFPNPDDFTGGVIKNQVQATIPTSTGGALLEVNPIGTFVPPESRSRNRETIAMAQD